MREIFISRVVNMNAIRFDIVLSTLFG